MNPRVELIYDTDCPNVNQAREMILLALFQTNLPAVWTEYDRKSEKCPPFATCYGSPTILVNGSDVSGMSGDIVADCCRLYVHAHGYGGVPELSRMVHVLEQSKSRGLRLTRFVAVLASFGALLPVLSCPGCWPVYTGVLGTIGLGFLSETAYLLPITAVLLAVSLLGLGYKARFRRGYLPLVIGIMAAVAVLAGKFWIANDLFLYVGFTGLVAMSIWNALPPKEVYCVKE